MKKNLQSSILFNNGKKLPKISKATRRTLMKPRVFPSLSGSLFIRSWFNILQKSFPFFFVKCRFELMCVWVRRRVNIFFPIPEKVFSPISFSSFSRLRCVPQQDGKIYRFPQNALDGEFCPQPRIIFKLWIANCDDWQSSHRKDSAEDANAKKKSFPGHMHRHEP